MKKTKPDTEHPYQAFGYPHRAGDAHFGAFVILGVLFIFQMATKWSGSMIDVWDSSLFLLAPYPASKNGV
jgi:hypothetical protein